MLDLIQGSKKELKLIVPLGAGSISRRSFDVTVAEPMILSVRVTGIWGGVVVLPPEELWGRLYTHREWCGLRVSVSTYSRLLEGRPVLTDMDLPIQSQSCSDNITNLHFLHCDGHISSDLQAVRARNGAFNINTGADNTP